MTIAIFGNAMKSDTLREVQHILTFMTEQKINVLLSQELRQELDLREYPSFPENWDGEQQPENVYGEPIDFALSVDSWRRCRPKMSMTSFRNSLTANTPLNAVVC